MIRAALCALVGILICVVEVGGAEAALATYEGSRGHDCFGGEHGKSPVMLTAKNIAPRERESAIGVEGTSFFDDLSVVRVADKRLLLHLLNVDPPDGNLAFGRVSFDGRYRSFLNCL